MLQEGKNRKENLEVSARTKMKTLPVRRLFLTQRNVVIPFICVFICNRFFPPTSNVSYTFNKFMLNASCLLRLSKRENVALTQREDASV